MNHRLLNALVRLPLVLTFVGCGNAAGDEQLGTIDNVGTDVPESMDGGHMGGSRVVDAAASPPSDAGSAAEGVGMGEPGVAAPSNGGAGSGQSAAPGPTAISDPMPTLPAASDPLAEPDTSSVKSDAEDAGAPTEQPTDEPEPGEPAPDEHPPDEPAEEPAPEEPEYDIEALMIPGDVACTTLVSGFDDGPGNTNFATLYWNADIQASECRLEPGFEPDDDAPALLRFGEELGLYGPFSIWQGDNGGFGFGVGFEEDDANNVPADVDLSVIVNVDDPPIVLEVFFRFGESEVTVEQVVQR